MGPRRKFTRSSKHPRFEMLSGVGEFTSACGITYYRGSSFTAEPVHGIIHRDVLSDHGAIYLAKRAKEGVEFLASTDAWFRPVNMYVGPDGAMYVLDFYRKMIEHPEWMSSKCAEIAGSDQGHRPRAHLSHRAGGRGRTRQGLASRQRSESGTGQGTGQSGDLVAKDGAAAAGGSQGCRRGPGHCAAVLARASRRRGACMRCGRSKVWGS